MVIKYIIKRLKNIPKRHFSLTKGYYIAKGFSNIIETYYLTKGESYEDEKLNITNIDEIDDFFMQNIKYILLIREANIIDIIETANTAINSKKRRGRTLKKYVKNACFSISTT